MKVSKIVPKPIETKKLRVAAYCRVSTDSDEQQNSFETQKAHYEAWIKIHDDWEFAGLFYDFGVTITNILFPASSSAVSAAASSSGRRRVAVLHGLAQHIFIIKMTVP